MASQRTKIEMADAEPPHAAPERAIASDVHAELRAALDGDLARQVRFWRARAEEVAAQMDGLRKRLLALSERLPARYAQLLTCDPAALQRAADWPDPLAGWKETVELEPASVATELARLWERLGPLPPR